MHGGQPLMAWCVAMPGWSLKVTPSLYQTGQRTGKIDPLMALFNAVSLMSLNPEPKKKEYAVFSYNPVHPVTIMDRCGGFFIFRRLM
ncbi:terminase [Escherichia coli]|nr:terminase [Escherichia coli]